jgi:hypothetical protein
MDVSFPSCVLRGRSGIFLLWFSAVFFVGIVAWNLWNYVPYRAGLTFPQTWQGAIEAVVLFALLCLALQIRRALFCALAMGAIAEVYLRRHGVDVATIVDLAYFESIVLIGVACSRWFGTQGAFEPIDYLRAFVLGLIVWGLCAWTLSAIGWGSVRALRTMSIALALIAFAQRSQPISVFAFRRLRSMRRVDAFLVVALLTWLLVLFAKTSVALNFDALWYSLRGEYVLVGDGSAFRPLGLTSPVYYFPKLYELLLIPVSGLGSASIISGVTVLLLTLFALTGSTLLDQLGVKNRTARLAIILACVTLPAISNCAIDPKPDLLAALLLLLAWSYAMHWVERRSTADACWAAACLLLATQAKLTAIPYAAAIVLSTAILSFLTRRPNEDAATSNGREAWFALGGACIVACYVTARTLILTGMPTIGPDALFHLWEKFGFTLHAPAGTQNWNRAPNFSDAPTLAVDLLFRPQNLEHIINYWTGNIWLWLAALSIVFALCKQGDSTARVRYIGIALGFTGIALMFCFGYSIRGSDGNYYVAAIASGTLVGGACVWRRLRSDALRAAFIGCLLFFVSFHAAYSFVSSNWTTGTRAFDLDFHRSVRELRRENRQLFVSNGMSAIETYLRHLHRAARVVTCMDDNLSMRLPARTESVQQISYARLRDVMKAPLFPRYLAANNIQFLVLPHDENSFPCVNYSVVQTVAHQIAEDPDVTRIDDVSYVMYDLTRWLEKHPEN